MGARSRLEKQPTDFRQNICYFGDRTLTRQTAEDFGQMIRSPPGQKLGVQRLGVFSRLIE
jgi:hypothetical protein